MDKKNKPKRKARISQSGMTLIEAAMSITILGILLAGMLVIFERSEDKKQPFITEHNMAVIVSALSNYAETYGRLPCPADPSRADAAFGWEWGTTPADATTAQTSAPIGDCSVAGNDIAGIVPFQTLNLEPEAAIDGWGRYITYTVSPVFTLDNDANTPNPAGQVPDESADQVHERCRDTSWITGNDNINTIKARFCCVALPATGPYHAPNTDIRMEDVNNTGTSIGPALRYNAATAPAPNPYGTLTTLETAALASDISTPAIALISHGENGRGAFLANNTAGQMNIDNSFTLERENWEHNTNRTYYTGETSKSNTNANYFDDIVIWMTQEGIMAANGTSSCFYP